MSSEVPAHVDEVVRLSLGDAGIEVVSSEERRFPGERWYIYSVASDSVAAAQSLAGALEHRINDADPSDESAVVMFRPAKVQGDVRDGSSSSRLRGPAIDQLIQLLEARSRTSDALPSLKYMEDPRASLASIGASRHQFVYGRRGVGKTALLLEAKRLAEVSGDVTVWLNAHVLRDLTPESGAAAVASLMLSSLARFGGSSTGALFKSLSELSAQIEQLQGQDPVDPTKLAQLIPHINNELRRILSGGFIRLLLYIDDFYLMPTEGQPAFLDHVAGMLRDCDAWIKIASIERLTRPYEPSSRRGLEIPHDASRIDLDVTLEDPAAAQRFLESVLQNYVETAGVGSITRITKPEALGRLVLASGGVPRDYLNLFASSILVAREARDLAREVGKEDVAVAAGRSARTKKRDLEQDVIGGSSSALLDTLDWVSERVKGAGFAYFRIDARSKDSRGYELFALLVDLRFAHLVQASLSDQHKSGVRYEAYILDLSEFADVRLKRGLNLLDLEGGRWVHRETGVALSSKALTAEQLRDRLRRSPVVPLDEVSNL